MSNERDGRRGTPGVARLLSEGWAMVALFAWGMAEVLCGPPRYSLVSAVRRHTRTIQGGQ